MKLDIAIEPDVTFELLPTMDKALALDTIGGLSSPSKMPCYSFSIPASKCITGQKLRSVKGSICSFCYALKGRYIFKVVQDALFRRFGKLNNPRWIEAMAFLINKVEKSGFFRWHDSGDLQSVEHLARIAEVCRLTPNVQHWLPTREYGMVRKYMETNIVPANLTIRLSAFMVDGAPPTGIAKLLGLVTSGVSPTGFTCPSSQQKGKCLDCRACWSKDVANVNYKKH
jgi:hypothetical protein